MTSGSPGPGDPPFDSRKSTSEDVIREFLDRAHRDPRFAHLAEAEERKRAQREAARDTVRTTGQHLTRDEQLKLLTTELRAHDQEVPPRPLLDVELDRLMNPDEAEGQRQTEKATQVATDFLKTLFNPGDALASQEVAKATPGRETGRGVPGAGKHSKGRTKNPSRQPHMVIPMRHDRTRTTEIVVDPGNEYIVRHHQDPPADEELEKLPFLGPMLRLSEIRPASLSFLTLRLRPTKEDGLLVLLDGRRVGVVDASAAPEGATPTRRTGRDHRPSIR